MSDYLELCANDYSTYEEYVTAFEKKRQSSLKELEDSSPCACIPRWIRETRECSPSLKKIWEEEKKAALQRIKKITAFLDDLTLVCKQHNLVLVAGIDEELWLDKTDDETNAGGYALNKDGLIEWEKQ